MALEIPVKSELIDRMNVAIGSDLETYLGELCETYGVDFCGLTPEQRAPWDKNVKGLAKIFSDVIIQNSKE